MIAAIYARRSVRIGRAFMLFLTANCSILTPSHALSLDEWLKVTPRERSIYIRGVMSAWDFQEQMDKVSKPPLATPPHVTAITSCVRDIKMTNEQALGIV